MFTVQGRLPTLNQGSLHSLHRKVPFGQCEDGLGKEGRGMKRPPVPRGKCQGTGEAFTPNKEGGAQEASGFSRLKNFSSRSVWKLGHPCMSR